MIHNVQRLVVPTFNNSLLDDDRCYLHGDLIAVKIIDTNSIYFYQVLHSHYGFTKCVTVVRTFSNNYRI